MHWFPVISDTSASQEHHLWWHRRVL